MADEMYLQKKVQYNSGDYVDADEDGSLYKGVVVLMVQGPKIFSICYKSLSGSESGWSQAHKRNFNIYCISSFAKNGFKVRPVVTDNHSANVSTFKHLTKMHPSSASHYIEVPKYCQKRIFSLTVCTLSRIYTITCLMRRS